MKKLQVISEDSMRYSVQRGSTKYRALNILSDIILPQTVTSHLIVTLKLGKAGIIAQSFRPQAANSKVGLHATSVHSVYFSTNTKPISATAKKMQFGNDVQVLNVLSITYQGLLANTYVELLKLRFYFSLFTSNRISARNKSFYLLQGTRAVDKLPH